MSPGDWSKATCGPDSSLGSLSEAPFAWERPSEETVLAVMVQLLVSAAFMKDNFDIV